MTYRFTIPGNLASLNDYITACKGSKGYLKANQMKHNDQLEIANCIHKTISRKTKIRKPIRVHFRWYEGHSSARIDRYAYLYPKKKRSSRDTVRDLDNIAGYGHKVIFDAMQDAGLIVTDGPEVVKGFTDEFFTDKDHPRVEVEIEEIS